MERVTRRNLLIGGAAVAVLPAGLLASHAATSRSSMIVDYLRRQLPGLAIPDATLEQFAEEYLDQRVFDPGFSVYYNAMFLMLANPMVAAAAPGRAKAAFEQFSRGLLSRFMLATDFFGAAEQQPERTHFIGTDPYASGCANPIARFDLPE